MIQWGVFLGGAIKRSGRNFNKPIEEKEVADFINLIEASGKKKIRNYIIVLVIYLYN